MRIINSVPWTAQEIEAYRLQIFFNLVHGMRLLLDCLKDMSDGLPPPPSSFTTLPPSSPYMMIPPQSPHPSYPSPPSIVFSSSSNARQRSESLSSNASTLTTHHTGTTLHGIPLHRPLVPRRKLAYSTRHAELRARLDGIPDLREGDPFPPEVGNTLMELWGAEVGVEWVGSRKISVTKGEEAERVVEIDTNGTSVGKNDLRECVERAKVGGNLPDK